MKKSVRKVSKKKTYNNRLMYSLIALGVLIVVAVTVYADSPVTPYPNPGHPLSQLQICNTAGDILEMSGGAWVCTKESDPTVESWAKTNSGDINSKTLTTTGSISIGDSATVLNSVTASVFYYSSDRRLKMNITDLSGIQSLQNLQKLQGVSFNWKSNGEPDLGLIAQDVQTVYPQLVSNTGANGTLAVNYVGLIAPLIETVKFQQQEINDLQQQINELNSNS